MGFSPQRRALFRHLNCQKWSERGVFCTFWLGNVLRATTACTFSTSQLPKVVPGWGALYILTWKCASRHNGVHFFDISTAKSGPHLVCFVHFDLHMCFAPQRRAIFHLSSGQLAPHSSYSFSSTLLSSNLSLLSASSLLCFSSVHIVGSLTSKVPSTNRSCGTRKVRISSHVCVSDTHDLHRGSRFVSHALAAPAAKRERDLL